MSNTLSDTEKNSLDLLSSKDFAATLNSMYLAPENHNLLWLAHIATVLSQSQGVKSIEIQASYMVNDSLPKDNLPKDNLPKDNLPKDNPYMNCKVKVSLTNRGYVTNSSYTGGNLTVWHPNDFGFYKASHVNTWIREQVKDFKILPPYCRYHDVINLFIEKENKRDNSNIIYEKLSQYIPEFKSILTNHFLNQQLDAKVEQVNEIKKLKI